MSDAVNHPSHYTQHEIECIEFFEHLHLVTFDTQTNGCGQSAKATADDDSHGSGIRVAAIAPRLPCVQTGM